MNTDKKLSTWFAKLIMSASKKTDRKISTNLTWANALMLYKRGLGPDEAADNLMSLHEDFKMGGFNMTPFGDTELYDYIKRIRDKKVNNTPSTWNKDKLTLPHIHSTIAIKVIGKDGENSEGYDQVVDEHGKKLKTDILRKIISERPTSILKQNVKTEHSDELIFIYGLPALKGLALDEDTGKFFIVDTCPGAGSCMLNCFAMKGGYIQWKDGTLKFHKLLTWLLNDPAGFEKKLTDEIANARKTATEVNRTAVIRPHDSGDFFAPAYHDMIVRIAKKFDGSDGNPVVQFGDYTKMASHINADKGSNYQSNFSLGSKQKEIDQVDLRRVKLSLIVPRNLWIENVTRAVKVDGKIIHLDSSREAKITPAGTLQYKKIIQDICDRTGIDPKKAEKTYPIIYDYKSPADIHALQTKLANSINGHALEVDKSKLSGSKAQLMTPSLIKKYNFNVDPKSIITYGEMLKIPKSGIMFYNVMVLPSTDGDDAAFRSDVWLSLLFEH